jgi:thiol-disulfide isomerase/thioredoxin
MRARRAATALACAFVLAGCGDAVGSTSAPSAPSTSVAASGPGDVTVGMTRYAASERVAAPSISGTTLGGTALDLASLRGKVVVLNSWASWCGPCKDELPELVSLAKGSDLARVAFVGLDVKDEHDGAVAMAAAYGIPYPSIADPDGRLLLRVPGVPPDAVPSTVVLDREGRIAARVIGSVEKGQLEPVLADLVAEK